MDRFHAMTVFARVADAGSFTKAAESLGVSRASVSSAIQQLEAHLGARLIQRTTRRVSLTPEVRAFEERCRRILADLDDSEQLFQRSTSRAGRLTLDVPTRIARRVLIPALPEYLAKNPGLEVRLGASDRTIDLVEKGVDAVVRVGPLQDSSYVARPLGALPQVNCASPSYLARRPPPKRLEDLARHVLVHYSPKLGGAAEWDYVAGGVLRSRRVDSAVTVDNAETYVACALAGLGIIQVPAYDVRHHLESGALLPLLPDFAPPALPIAILYPSKRHLPSRVRAFADWAEALFARHGMTDRSASG